MKTFLTTVLACFIIILVVGCEINNNTYLVGPANDDNVIEFEDIEIILIEPEDTIIMEVKPLRFAPDTLLTEPVWGLPWAKVKVYAYVAFQEPFSARWWDSTFSVITKTFDTSEVSVTFVNFPLSFLDHSFYAAMAGEIANQHGKFLEFADLLFTNYKNIDSANIEAWIHQTGIPPEKFRSMMNDPLIRDEVQSDIEFAMNQLPTPISGVPVFYIRSVGGIPPFVRINGALPTGLFLNEIENALCVTGSSGGGGSGSSAKSITVDEKFTPVN